MSNEPFSTPAAPTLDMDDERRAGAVRGAGLGGVQPAHPTRAALFGGGALLNLLRLGDGATATCALTGALLIWNFVAGGPFAWGYVTEHAVWFLLVAAWMPLLLPARRPAVMWSLQDTAVVTAHAVVAVSLLYALIFFLAPRGLLPRLPVVYFTALAFLMTMAWRFVFIQFVSRVWPRIHVAIVGAGPAARVIADVLRARAPHIEVLAFVSDSGPARDPTLSPVVGADGVERLIAEQGVSELILAHDRPFAPALFRAVVDARTRRVDVLEMQTVYEQLLHRIPVRHLKLDAVQAFSGNAGDNLFPLAKRAVDILAGVVGCAVVLLLLPVLAPAIWLDVRGAIFFWQQRIGLAGRPFQLVKFRTMGSDAERLGPRWAGKRDPRVSGFGQFLRRFHLDELPQSWNLLKGEMSLVGPRPERPEFTGALERAIPHYAERCVTRPGLTGWAQINHPYGRSMDDSVTKLEYDLYYIKHRSLPFDLLIGLRTAWAILALGNR